MRTNISITQIICLLFSCFSMFFISTVWNNTVADTAKVKIKIVQETERENIPVEGVKCLIRKGEITIDSKKTKSDGIAHFKDIKPGIYFFRIITEKIKEDFKKWALPSKVGPKKIKRGLNKFTITSKKGVKVIGRISYRGEISLDKGHITSDSSQQSFYVKENGKFQLYGVYPSESAEIRVYIGDYKADFSPAYERVVSLEGYQVTPGETIDIGNVEVPYAGKDEYMRLLIYDDRGKENLLSQNEIYKSGEVLIIKRIDGKIVLYGYGSSLDTLIGNNPEDGGKIRLPSGKYRAWWKGYKDQKVYEFSISGNQQPKVAIRLPSNE